MRLSCSWKDLDLGNFSYIKRGILAMTQWSRHFHDIILAYLQSVLTMCVLLINNLPLKTIMRTRTLQRSCFFPSQTHHNMGKGSEAWER